MVIAQPDDPNEASFPDSEIRQTEFAHQLARLHNIKSSQSHEALLLEYLEDWDQTLRIAHSTFEIVPSKDVPVSQGAEWMLDNFYLIQQALLQIEEGLPLSFFDELPKLGATHLMGYPRVFAVASEWLGFTQCQIELTSISAFIQEYQVFTPLAIGELWALPNMLRIAILERLAIAAAELTGLPVPKPLSNFQSPFASPALANEAIIANCLISLRILASTNWQTFFEQTSRVERILREDPANIYGSMDFETRNSYRSVIEDLARHSAFSEEQVAKKAIEFSKQAQDDVRVRKAHVGYFLRDSGRTALEKHLSFRPAFRTRVERTLLAYPTFAYLGSITSVFGLLLLGLLAYASFSGDTLWQTIVVGVLGFGLALESAITFVNRTVTHFIRPQSLPRMDFSKGIPPQYQTMVVVPTLLENENDLARLLRGLELYYLSNPDPQLTFALLTDFGDAHSRDMPGDEKLFELAREGVDTLNQKYSQPSPFYLFHRQRVWNPSENAWMGWERKRGKLAEFNDLLLDQGETTFVTQIGDLSVLPGIKYVITLDADTSLPQGSANQLIATLAHPLNQAEFAADNRSVIAGYTVLQPRVAVKPSSANRSPFSQIYGGNAGFDLYSFAVSDVYQDLFGEGSYVGKGIYDVSAFERSLVGQVRENTILSHDLFEGIYGRAALVTDVVLYEEYPSRYLEYARRLRRWVRGDWQLTPWLLPVVRTQDGLALNRLSLINIWKIADNLRRSLLPPSLVALLVAGWLKLPGAPLVWTALVILPSAAPIVSQTIRDGMQHLAQRNIKRLLETTWSSYSRWLHAIVFLPYEALLMAGAIITTLTRLLVARKNLLQWTTAANAKRSLKNNQVLETWVEMSASVFLTVLIGISVALFNPMALYVAAPLLITWLAAPQIAYLISQPFTNTSVPLSETQLRQVRRLARRTWAFFEEFAGPNDHWLPPDHFQEAPNAVVAHYTTPTNIGLFLVSTMAAYDLGFIGLYELADRLRLTLDSMDQLEHYRGHLLNWYDSQTKSALPPHYVSTVDSGNLAASLITVKQGCVALTDAPLMRQEQWEGLLVTVDILIETLLDLKRTAPHASIKVFEIELTTTYHRINETQNHLVEWAETLDWLNGEGWEKISLAFLNMLEQHPNLKSEPLAEFQHSLNLMQHQMSDMARSLALFMPWLNLKADPPETARLAPGWQDFSDSLPVELLTLRNASATYEQIRLDLNQFEIQNEDQLIIDWCQTLVQSLISAQMVTSHLMSEFQELAQLANNAVEEMDFGFLYNQRRQVFHIGYNASTEQLDQSYYDLLASESRIASFIAIAKGDVPQTHWQHLGRPVTNVNSKMVLLSWSGTMFEYLMPTLFAKNYAGTFLLDSCCAALDAHVRYGRDHHVPWGISESGYRAFDINMNYQYHAFGVPSLGYKRDQAENLVIAPYASMLGLSLAPQTVLENMTSLDELDMLGRYGYYESVDFTKNHLPPDQNHAIVQSYMAHHQGMILLAICNYLDNDIMVKRFHSDERVQSIELILQENIPHNPPIEYPHSDENVDILDAARMVRSTPWLVPVNSPTPQVHVLSQGDASVMISNAGGGYSQWKGIALTRWRADTTLDNWGSWIYLQDLESGACWSATCQPLGTSQTLQKVLFSPHMVEFRRRDNNISLRTEITVSTSGVEIRRVNILNDSDRPRRLRLTSYSEVVLEKQNVDRRHPAFNKLFIESEYLSEENALIFHRRPRSVEDPPIFLAHALVLESEHKKTGLHESDRSLFVGRSQTQRTPFILQDVNRSLSNSTGGTLDPIMSLAQEIELKPHSRTRVSFLTVASSSRADVLEKVNLYQTQHDISLAFEESRVRSERELLELGLNANAVENIQLLYSALLYPTGILRAEPHILAQNDSGQSGLWAFGISGDHPIILVRIENGESPLLLEALQAFNYWRNRHITVNLVILNMRDTDYAIDLHNTIQRQIARMGATAFLNQRDGIFVLSADQLRPADKTLFEFCARVILDEKDGTLAEQAKRLNVQPSRLPGFTPSRARKDDQEPTPALQDPVNLTFENGLGGFTHDGKEYLIHLQPEQHTPHPWINVIANPQFGFTVSESGSGYTWAENSGENRLTPWRNDPVIDMPGEALYLRDEETGLVWSPTPMPAGADSSHIIRHGAGYSTFESQSHGLNQRLCLFAAANDPVKIAHLRLENLWALPRRITVTYYAEWVLGIDRDTNQTQILPEFDPQCHALLATNRYNSEFKERVAFLAASKKPHGVTTDRTEFLGRLGSMENPSALGRIGLASAVHAGLDPCAAIQLHVDLAPGASEEVFFLLGQGRDRKESLALIDHYNVPSQIESTFQQVIKQWDQILDTITVETPDPSMDLMLNRWLMYQTITSRLWGRTGLYQSSGAYGFRDQLQDVMAVLHTRPDIARAQILEAARHQFMEGDVLHWWNPPSGRGVRTRFSDDLLWLPYVAAEYFSATGDQSILDEQLPFLGGAVLAANEVERYALFDSLSESTSLYDHCLRALEKGATSGEHGLPLMGAGDWNDGMNRVGIDGRGESIWLGWFLIATLRRFAVMAASRGDDPHPFLQKAEKLSQAIEAHAWDGDWYLRAYYDDGSRLGSRLNHECQIDSIAQSWAVLSEAGAKEHTTQAMASVQRLLVNEAEQIILLFTPPFDLSGRDPGYIKGYFPGVRENGGQYTHAAIWTAWAFAKLGYGDIATNYFQMMNPINHSDSASKTALYKVEPYVVAADIYSETPHKGKGGWTWYTGSSGWMYRLGIEAILGISREGDNLKIDPCIPKSWPGFKVNYRFGNTHFIIQVSNPHGVNQGIKKILMNGIDFSGSSIPLVDDGLSHEMLVILG